MTQNEIDEIVSVIAREAIVLTEGATNRFIMAANLANEVEEYRLLLASSEGEKLEIRKQMTKVRDLVSEKLNPGDSGREKSKTTDRGKP
jgi:hypothetical protein